MFLDELTPLFTQLANHPIAFLGGFVSGALHLNLSEDPVRTWLSQQASSANAYPSGNTTTPNGKNNGKNSGPQSISID